MRYVGGFKWLILDGSFFPRLSANSFNCPFMNFKFYLVLLGPELLPPWDSHSSELSLLMGSSIHLLWTGLQLLYLDFWTKRTTLRTFHTRCMHLADFTEGSVDRIFFFFLLQQHKLHKLKPELALLLQWYIPTHFSFTVSNFIFLLLSPTSHHCPPAIPDSFTPQFSYLNWAPGWNLTTDLFFNFLKPRCWLMGSVEAIPSTLDLTHLLPTGITCAIPSTHTSRVASGKSSFVFSDSYRWMSGVIIWWLKYFSLSDLIFDYRLFGWNSEMHGTHTLQGWPQFIHSFFFLTPDNTELYRVFFLDMISSEAPSNPVTWTGQVVYQSGLSQGLENKREFNVKA